MMHLILQADLHMLKECEKLNIPPWQFKNREILGLKFTWAKLSGARVCVCMLDSNSNSTVKRPFLHWSPSDVQQSYHSLFQQLFDISFCSLSRVALDLHYCIFCKHYSVTASELSQLQRRAMIWLCLSHVCYSRCCWDLRYNMAIMKAAGRNICSAS